MGAYSVTSPNVSAIPFMPAGHVTLCMETDGRYGQHDFTICPQVFSADHPHRILVRDRRSPHNIDIDCAWWNPAVSDFEALPNSSYSDLGRCSSPQINRLDELSLLLKARLDTLSASCHSAPSMMLHKLAASMRHAMLFLRFNTYTMREMVIGVAYAQRSFLDALALADYVEYSFHARLHGSVSSVHAPSSHILGASSTDVVTVNHLQVAGVPAYLIVPHEEVLVLGATAVAPTQPSFSSTTNHRFEDTCSKPTPSFYTGIASSAMHDIMTLPPSYTTLERYFIGLDNHSNVVPLGVRGMIITSSLPAAKCKPTHKCTFSDAGLKLILIIICSAKYRIISTASTRQMGRDYWRLCAIYNSWVVICFEASGSRSTLCHSCTKTVHRVSRTGPGDDNLFRGSQGAQRVCLARESFGEPTQAQQRFRVRRRCACWSQQ